MIIKGKEWQVIGIYPSFYLCKNELGFRECFLKIDIDGVAKVSLDRRQQIYYIDDIPYTIKQMMSKYNLSYGQVKYRIHQKKALPDGKFIQVVDM